jgi:hypothetical protein
MALSIPLQIVLAGKEFMVKRKAKLLLMINMTMKIDCIVRLPKKSITFPTVPFTKPQCVAMFLRNITLHPTARCKYESSSLHSESVFLELPMYFTLSCSALTQFGTLRLQCEVIEPVPLCVSRHSQSSHGNP